MPPYTPSEAEIRGKPWMYLGYEAFSAFMGSSDDFMVVRRFDTLAARVILLLQWELTEIEQKLNTYDQALRCDPAQNHNNGAFQFDVPDRTDVIRDAYVKLKEYCELLRICRRRANRSDEFLNLHAMLRAKADATKDTIQELEKWLSDHGPAIDHEEAGFVKKDDLFPLGNVTRIPLRQAFEKFSVFSSRTAFQRSGNLPVAPISSFGKTNYFNDRRMDSFINAVICITGFTMLAIPLWVLFYVSSKRNQLVVIVIFIALFLLLVQSVSVARPFESLAATAA